jgi:hypothetical protein
MINQILKPTSVISFLIVTSVTSFPQEKTLITPYIQLQYFKNTDDQRLLQTTLTYSVNRMELPLSAMEISFYFGSAKKEKIASVKTDEKGIARYTLTNEVLHNGNSDGPWAFSSDFKGNDTVEAGTSAIEIKDVKLVMTLAQVDTVKTIILKALTRDKGREIPVAGEVVKIYVPRMFSLLPVGEATLDETGSATFEFPSDLPGDTIGNITIISRFEEHPAFGNVEKRKIQKWGIPTNYSIPKTHRALWTKTPPMWMIITLSILLAGVWGHYLFAVISLIIIKIDAKRKAARDKYRV